MIGEPYRWQCEAERCYRQRDRAGRWHAHGRDMGEVDPGAGNRYHPECHPRPTLGLDWAHRPALGTTCRTDADGTTTADACAWCARPLRLTDRTYADGSPVWEVAPMA